MANPENSISKKVCSLFVTQISNKLQTLKLNASQVLKKLRGISSLATYTDRAIAAGQRS
jgi:hypothetical protein